MTLQAADVTGFFLGKGLFVHKPVRSLQRFSNDLYHQTDLTGFIYRKANNLLANPSGLSDYRIFNALFHAKI